MNSTEARQQEATKIENNSTQTSKAQNADATKSQKIMIFVPKKDG